MQMRYELAVAGILGAVVAPAAGWAVLLASQGHASADSVAWALVAGLTVGATLSWWLSGRVLRRIEGLSGALDEAAGTWSEPGALIDVEHDPRPPGVLLALNRLLERLRGLAADLLRGVGGITTSAAALRGASETLDGQAAALQGQADNLKSWVNEVSMTVSSSAEVSEQAATGLGSMVEANRQISEEIQRIAAEVAQASDSMRAVSEATREMGVSLDEVAQVSSRTAESSAVADASARAAQASMRRLADDASQVDRVIALIEDLADQTNLLALNASIEAAGAGEAGLGFAVVAGEVKALSRETAGATEQIRAFVKLVQRESRESAQQMDALTGQVAALAELNGRVAAAVEQQSSTMREIARNVQRTAEAAGTIEQGVSVIGDNAQAVADASEEVQYGVETVAMSAAELSVLFEDMGASMDALDTIAKEASGAARVVRAEADDIHNQAGALRLELSSPHSSP